MGKISVTDADEIWGCSEPDSQNQVTIQGLKKGLVAFFTKRGIPIPDDKVIAVSLILACDLYAGLGPGRCVVKLNWLYFRLAQVAD